MINMKEFRFELTAIPADSDWGRCITDFIAHIYSKSNSPHSQDHYRSGLEQFFSRSPRKLPHEYTKAEVIAWLTSPGCGPGREGSPVKPQTLSNRLIVLAGLYRYSQSYGVQGDDGHLYPLMRYYHQQQEFTTRNVLMVAIRHYPMRSCAVSSMRSRGTR